MNEMVMWVLSFVAGGVLGAVFFGGLWWTVQRGLNSPRPALWFLGSAIVRTAIVLVGFYLVSAGQWERLSWCVLGFTLVRPFINHWVKSRDVTQGVATVTEHVERNAP